MSIPPLITTHLFMTEHNMKSDRENIINKNKSRQAMWIMVKSIP